MFDNRRLVRISLAAAATLLLVGAGHTAALAGDSGRVAPKVVLIVGPAGTATAYYRQLAEETATAAAKLTPNVVRIYSPAATWERVKAALQGASIVVYLGHGNGWPSIYRNALYPPTQDGFGLNPLDGAADAHQYFGEDRIGSEIKLAPNALVVFSHLCYASGNTEPGLAEGTLDQAQQRVDNYAAGFLKAGAGAVIADSYLSPTYYVTAVLRGRKTVDRVWQDAPDRNDHFLTFASRRTLGAIAEMDPDQVESGFHRSLVTRLKLSSAQVLGGAARRLGNVDPILEPSLTGLGITFGAPDLTTPPTTGLKSTFVLPVARDAAALLPTKLMIGTRWDRLDVGAAESSILDPGAPAAGTTGTPTPSPTSTPTPTPSNLAGPSGSPDAAGPTAAPDGALVDLVVPEQPGEIVAPVAARRLPSGGLSVVVRVPSIPGLYRLVATIHDIDGLAYDAATQALVPALVVRVTGPRMATYQLPASATTTAGAALSLDVSVANLGRSPWGHPAGGPAINQAELVPAAQATLVARWVDLDGQGAASSGGAAGAGGATISILAAGMAPGSTVEVVLALTAPPIAGQYLLVLDVVDPEVGSLAALGVPPGIVRVTVGG